MYMYIIIHKFVPAVCALLFLVSLIDATAHCLPSCLSLNHSNIQFSLLKVRLIHTSKYTHVTSVMYIHIYMYIIIKKLMLAICVLLFLVSLTNPTAHYLLMLLIQNYTNIQSFLLKSQIMANYLN